MRLSWKVGRVGPNVMHAKQFLRESESRTVREAMHDEYVTSFNIYYTHVCLHLLYPLNREQYSRDSEQCQSFFSPFVLPQCWSGSLCSAICSIKATTMRRLKRMVKRGQRLPHHHRGLAQQPRRAARACSFFVLLSQTFVMTKAKKASLLWVLLVLARNSPLYATFTK